MTYIRFTTEKDDEPNESHQQAYKIVDTAGGDDLIVGLTLTGAKIIAKTLNSIDSDPSWTPFVQKG